MWGNGGAGDGGARAARQAEDQRQSNIRNGTAQINSIFDSQFNDDFYKGRRQAYIDYATPQLNDQYADTRKQLTYALDRNGTLDSTARSQKEAELTKLYDTNRRAVSDQGLDYENQARNNVTAARGDLINQLSNTGDVTAAVNAATTRAAGLTAPDAYSPLAQMFSSFTSGLQQQAALEQANAAYGTGAGRPQVGRYNIGLFTGTPDAVRVY